MEVNKDKVGPNTKLGLYCQQLNHLKQAIDQKRSDLANGKGVMFHQGNVRPHTSVVTRQKLWELGWEVLMHPPYSSDLAPSDCHLLLALLNFLGDKKLESREDCENRLLEFSPKKVPRLLCERHYEAAFKMATNYATKRCIFDPNRTIRAILNEVLNSIQK
ncbi:histone-lysine N-methyltransferase SETMAR [Trichonephila clavipes]|nr:histone-lysine N-methyltransferase SETMAR [Trichonephila clavipes]